MSRHRARIEDGIASDGPMKPRYRQPFPPMVGFALRFILLMSLYYALVLLPFFDRLLYSYLCANARITNGILNVLGTDSHVFEATIRSARFVMNVRRGCDAIEPAWFFSAAVICFPGPWAAKVPGLLLGTIVILAFNLIRLVSLYIIGIRYPKVFAVAHLEIWPAGFILLAVLLFLGWIAWTRGSRRVEAHVAP